MPDALDNAADADVNQVSSSEPNTDTATSGSPEGGNQTSDPAANGTSADAGSAVADNPTDDGAQPSLTGSAEADAEPNQEAQYQKQYREVQGWATKVHQTNLDLKRQLEELQSQFKTTQPTKTSEPQLQPWDEGHAEHAQFLRLVDKAEYFDELIQGEDDPEMVKRLQQKQLRVLGDQGIQTLRNWRTDVRNQERERRLNPKAFYSKLIRQEAQPVVQETLKSTSQNYQQMIQAQQQAQKWVSGNPDVATPSNIQQVLKLMESGVSFDNASQRVERDHYRNQVSNAKKMSASAEEKERLLQGNASGAIARNPNAGKKVDVDKIRRDKGIKNSREFIDELFDLDKQGLL